MLPSGNDAAFVLAKHFGKFLFEKKGYTEKHKTLIRSFEFDWHGSFVKYFLKEMNEQASQLKMTNTNWDTPHGMGNRENLTTVNDMFKLCEKAVKMPLLRKIMATKVYACTAMQEDEKGSLIESQEYRWINTTRILGVDGIIGMKPGWTPAASHCLAINYDKDGHNFSVLAVQSKSKYHLWSEI